MTQKKHRNPENPKTQVKKTKINYKSIYMNGRSIRFRECKSDSAPRSDDLRPSIARSIDLAQIFFFFLNFSGGTELKTLHASPMKISYDKPGIKFTLGSSENTDRELAGSVENFPKRPMI